MRRHHLDQDRPGAVERVVLMFLAIAATVIVSLFVAAILLAIFLLYPAKPVFAEEIYRVPATCKPLASKYGIPERVNGAEAMRIVGELDRYSWWPGVKQCRRAVQKEWKL